MQTIIEVKNLTHVYTDSENKEIKALAPGKKSLKGV